MKDYTISEKELKDALIELDYSELKGLALEHTKSLVKLILEKSEFYTFLFK